MAGAIAVAVGAAVAWQLRDKNPARTTYLSEIVPYVPETTVKDTIVTVLNMEKEGNPTQQDIIQAVGNGSGITAQDTVAHCLWCAGGHLESYAEAMWQTISGRGDMDTNCAIVGGIVALAVGMSGLPEEWRKRREALEAL